MVQADVNSKAIDILATFGVRISKGFLGLGFLLSGYDFANARLRSRSFKMYLKVIN